MAPLSRKTSCPAQVALQRCPILNMSKRKVMVPGFWGDVNSEGGSIYRYKWLSLGGKVALFSRQSGSFWPCRWLKETGIYKNSAASLEEIRM